MANEEQRNPNPGEEKKPGNVVLFYIIPFLLINLLIFFLVTLRPKFKLHIEESSDFRTAEIQVEMHPRLPLAAFEVKLDDAPLNLENLGGGHYKASVDKNGTLEVTVRYINGMHRTQYEHIGSVDDQPPLISGDELDGNMLTVSFDDPQSGINYDSIYAMDADEERVLPSSIDESENKAVFQVLTSRLEVHVSDKLGHEAVANFTELDAMGNGGDNSHEYHTYGTDDKTKETTAEEESSAEKNSGKSGKTQKKTSSASTTAAASSKAKETSAAAKTTAASSKAKETSAAAKTTAASSKAKETSAAAKTTAASSKAKETSATAKTTAASSKAKETSAAAKTTAASSKAKETSAAKTSSKANAVNNSGAPAPGETISGGKSGPSATRESKKSGSTAAIQTVEPLNP
ncbi:hypothetical protein QU660_08850 [Stomatobaculum sp. F0698]|nr:hypothetical protein [Stomatobaculum sp. F0698]WLD86582.1 hypothetical protein QU660_08850 [Stomatobaculum sp. F0698]